MSISIVVNTHGMAEAVAQLNRIAGFRIENASRLIAPILESQTRRRIEKEKRSPRGERWKPNREGTSILLKTGRHLRDSVAHRTAGADAIVEAHWKHARVHQLGAVIRPRNARRLVFRVGRNRQPIFAQKVTIPARPFIGLSAENHQEIIDELNAMLDDLGGAE